MATIFGPFTLPHGAARTDGVAMSAVPPCKGGAGSWEYNSDICVSVMQLGPEPETAGLYDWDIVIADNYVPTEVQVDVWGSLSSGTIGVEIFKGVAPELRSDMIVQDCPAGDDWVLSYSGAVNIQGEGWNLLDVTKDNIESTYWYVHLTFTDSLLSLIRGVQITVTAGATWDKVDVYAEPAWQTVNARPESGWNTDAEYAESAWKSTNEQAVTP